MTYTPSCRVASLSTPTLGVDGRVETGSADLPRANDYVATPPDLSP